MHANPYEEQGVLYLVSPFEGFVYFHLYSTSVNTEGSSEKYTICVNREGSSKNVWMAGSPELSLTSFAVNTISHEVAYICDYGGVSPNFLTFLWRC